MSRKALRWLQEEGLPADGVARRAGEIRAQGKARDFPPSALTSARKKLKELEGDAFETGMSDTFPAEMYWRRIPADAPAAPRPDVDGLAAKLESARDEIWRQRETIEELTAQVEALWALVAAHGIAARVCECPRPSVFAEGRCSSCGHMARLDVAGGSVRAARGRTM